MGLKLLLHNMNSPSYQKFTNGNLKTCEYFLSKLKLGCKYLPYFFSCFEVGKVYISALYYFITVKNSVDCPNKHTYFIGLLRTLEHVSYGIEKKKVLLRYLIPKQFQIKISKKSSIQVYRKSNPRIKQHLQNKNAIKVLITQDSHK